MPSFITRVELHNARAEDYAVLHKAMTNAKFHKTIKDDKGESYELPSAEYFSHGPNITATQVRDLALNAANSTGRTNWVLVSEYVNAAWSLRPVVKRNALAELMNRNPALPPNPLRNALTGGPFSNTLNRRY